MSTCKACKKDNPLSRWDKLKSNVMWKFFGQEVRDEQTSHATQEYARGYVHGREVETEIQSKVIEALRAEIDRLRIFRPIDIERVAVIPQEVIDTRNNVIYLGPNKITPSEANRLKEEAKQIKMLHIWSVLQETLKQKAIEKGHYLSQSFEELLASKMMLHSLGVIRSIVDMCASLQVKDEPL